MKRREFFTLVGGAAAWPLTARAQQPAMPVIGFLRTTPSAPFAHLMAAFRRGLNEVGFVEGQNVAIEQHWTEGEDTRLPALVADLMRRQTAVIVTNQPGALAAKAAGTTIPIVFASGTDPVSDGLVASLNRPGGNLTGVVFISSALGAKRLEILRQLAPKATMIAMLRTRSALKPRQSEEMCRTRHRNSGSGWSFPMFSARATSRQPLQPSSSVGQAD
jgi:putative tryptophan/tyrosine transport system substrate-binding protein